MTYDERLELFNDNIALPYHIAGRFKCPEEDREDMIQEGLLAMWQATATFDPDRGIRFTTFAGTAISRRYGKFTTHAWNSSGLSASDRTIEIAYQSIQAGDAPMKYRRLYQTAISTESTITGKDGKTTTISELIPSEDDLSSLSQQELHAVVLKAIDSCSEESQKLLKMRFGLDGSEPMTLDAIAEKLGCTRQTVTNRLSKLLGNLRDILPASAAEMLD